MIDLEARFIQSLEKVLEITFQHKILQVKVTVIVYTNDCVTATFLLLLATGSRCGWDSIENNYYCLKSAQTRQ